MRRDERGSAESVQWAVLTPLLALLVIGSVQVGIWLHGSTVAQHAAGAGAEAASVADGSEADARAVVGRMTGDLRDVQVSVVSDGGSVTVTVEGRTQTFLDLGQGYVRASITQPKEPR